MGSAGWGKLELATVAKLPGTRVARIQLSVSWGCQHDLQYNGAAGQGVTHVCFRYIIYFKDPGIAQNVVKPTVFEESSEKVTKCS